MTRAFRRAYAVEVDGEIVGFVRGPKRWDGYTIDHGLVAVGLPNRADAGDLVIEQWRSTRAPPP